MHNLAALFHPIVLSCFRVQFKLRLRVALSFMKRPSFPLALYIGPVAEVVEVFEVQPEGGSNIRFEHAR